MVSAVCSLTWIFWDENNGCCWLKPSLNPILGPWWRRAHLALSSWVSAAGCTFSILSFLFIASTILKLITKRNPSVTSPVLSGPCSELGTIWLRRKTPKSCRVVLGPTERLHHLQLAAPSTSAARKQVHWPLLAEAPPDFFSLHVISASPGCRLSLSLSSLQISCADLCQLIQGQWECSFAHLWMQTVAQGNDSQANI